MVNPDETQSLPAYKKTMLQVSAYRRIKGVVNSVLSRFDLSTTQWMILGILYESKHGIKVTDIANSLEVEVPLITRLSRGLHAEGLVKRTQNNADGRVRPLALTQHGKQMVDNVEAIMNKQMDEFEQTMDSQAVKYYFQSLQALTQKPSR